MFANELPISDAFLDQVDEFADSSFFVAHNSNDGTLEQIRSRANSKIYDVKIQTESGYSQSRIMTSLMQQAFRNGADVVIPLDFDEFIPFDSRDALIDFLSIKNIDVLYWYWRNVWPSEFGNTEMFRQNFFYSHKKSNFTKSIIFKSAFMKDPEVRLSQGSHQVMSDLDLIQNWNNNHQLIHIPIHGYFHYTQKILTGAARVYSANLGPFGGHWDLHAQRIDSLDSNRMRKLGRCYPEVNCGSLHITNQLDFKFPYIKSDYTREAESAYDSILGNIGLISKYIEDRKSIEKRI